PPHNFIYVDRHHPAKNTSEKKILEQNINYTWSVGDGGSRSENPAPSTFHALCP
ncbi:hypothetical protein TorRG33x02_050160, partial [Trema orientale]